VRIIDFHTHPVFEGKHHDRAQIDRLVAYGRSLGVERMIVLGDVLRYGRLPTADQVQSINDVTRELLLWHPDYFVGFCFVNPMLGRAFVEDETDRCIVDRGFRGIKLEICNNARDDSMEPVMAQAQKHDVVVLQHSADQTIIAQREYHTDPADTAWLGRHHPDVRIVMAHLTACGLRGVMEIVDVPNVWIDTSAYLPFAGLVEYATAKLGASRILYGSDLVIRELPSQIGRVPGASIPREAKAAILFENAATLVDRA
jgi:predicted TIM-barrel fold metal-dependent hydrolase